MTTMRAPFSLLSEQPLFKGFIALMLCYALMVQGLGSHHDRLFADAGDLLTLCSTDGKTSGGTPPIAPSHDDAKVRCCLIFGTGNLPQLSGDFAAFRFEIQLAVRLRHDFKYRQKDFAAALPSQPRAPPGMG